MVPLTLLKKRGFLEELPSPPVRRSLAGFTGHGYDKGRGVGVQACWFAVLNLAFVKWWLPPFLRPLVLRLFGADVGRSVYIRHNVRVHWPWKLTVMDDVWIGEGAWILNLEPVNIGHDVCVSQEALICTGGHDRRSPTFEFDNKAITLAAHCWIGARATVLGGVRVGEGCTVAASSVVTRDVDPFTLHVSREG